VGGWVVGCLSDVEHEGLGGTVPLWCVGGVGGGGGGGPRGSGEFFVSFGVYMFEDVKGTRYM
jgi:hypothetical protein